MIFDYDAHHGNGTQAVFYDDPRVLFVSFHQWPLYPGTGAVEETGDGAGAGTTLNIPMPPGTTGDVYLRAFDEIVAPGRRAIRADVGHRLGRVRRAPRRSADRDGSGRGRLRAVDRAGACRWCPPGAAW